MALAVPVEVGGDLVGPGLGVGELIGSGLVGSFVVEGSTRTLATASASGVRGSAI